MKNFKTIWKARANSKIVTVEDMLTYNILKAMSSKTQNYYELSKILIDKSFQPKGSDKNRYLSVKRAAFNVSITLKWKEMLLGASIKDIFDSEDELDLFKDILDSLEPYDFDRMYTYIFVRQDITPEYQLVQASHVALSLGTKLSHVNVDNLHFTVIGIPDLKELESIVDTKYDKVLFFEPDIDNELTAIAFYPIRWNERKELMNYNLLVFKNI